MASLWQRTKLIFASNASKALDKAEDPRKILDYSYEKQREMLTQVRRGVADVATSRKRVELQIQQLQAQQNTLQDQAKKAIDLGREDLAREALTRKAGITGQITELDTQLASLQADEEKLVLAQQQLTAKVEAFRTKKETIKANYTAAEAQVKIQDAVAGIGDKMGDVGMAIERAEEKTRTLQARAGAVDELLASGGLDDLTAKPGDDIARQLAELSAGSDVEAELAALKGIAAPQATPALEQPIITAESTETTEK
ncbi:phage shock protein A [Nocardioides baekrokdamisoli]|uniref:Phage shock protein A n=1 Tax=Nocardioides baekrokdamisoli TaxID=1804624 RepID=A0A3G9IQD4_9ACTN|nr:PspA/IM30 family protein [Nocardioides baekrokdamisoli]BBH18265.1 phage shock protein A [Nocardioides baekrokdamisoli]